MTLREPLAIGTQNCGEMGKLRYGPAKSLVDGHLLWGVRDMIVAANDVGDAHQRIVDGDDVVVNRHAQLIMLGRADKNWIADSFGGKLHRAADQVVEAQGLFADFQPNSVGLTGIDVLVDHLGFEVAAAARVDLRKLLLHKQFALGLKFLRSAEAAVSL